MNHSLEEQLGAELAERLRPVLAEPAPPAPRYRLGAVAPAPHRFLRGALASTGAKLAVGGIALASAAGATGLAAGHHGASGPAVAGSPQAIPAAVRECKERIRPEDRGIGACVSAAARHHGDADRDDHLAPRSPDPDDRSTGHRGTAGSAGRDLDSPAAVLTATPEPSERPVPGDADGTPGRGHPSPAPEAGAHGRGDHAGSSAH